MEVMHYLTREGCDPCQDWLDGLGDIKARVSILRRIDRLAAGSFDDHKLCRNGVWELRIALGPGYRLYYAIAGKTALLLLCAGSKRTQASDINRAINHWQDSQRRQS